MRFLDLWRWRGRVDRQTYAWVGITAFAIKHLLDWQITQHFMHDNSGLFFNYWAPFGARVQILNLTEYQTEFLATMLLTAMPFIWLGLAMTAKRLREAGVPVWLAAIFFVPIANVVFLVALCFAPGKNEGDVPRKEAAPWPGPRMLDGLIPRGTVGSALFAIVAAAAVGLISLCLARFFCKRTAGYCSSRCRSASGCFRCFATAITSREVSGNRWELRCCRW